MGHRADRRRTRRAEKIAFTAAYAEIEATYMVPPGSPLKTIADVDKPGVRIAVSARSAYDLWLERNIKHATLVRSTLAPRSTSSSTTSSTPSPACAPVADRREEDARRHDPRRPVHRRAAGGRHGKANTAAAAWLRSFVEEAKASGLVASFIEQFNVKGLSVAPPG